MSKQMADQLFPSSDESDVNAPVKTSKKKRKIAEKASPSQPSTSQPTGSKKSKSRATVRDLFGEESGDDQIGCSAVLSPSSYIDSPSSSINCDKCNIEIPKHEYRYHKRTNIHKSNCLIKSEFEHIDIIATAFKNRIVTYRLNPSKEGEYLLPEIFLDGKRDDLYKLIKLSLSKHTCIKVNFELFAYFVLPKSGEQQLKSFNTKYEVIYESTDLDNIYLNLRESFKMRLCEFEHCESGWSFTSLSHLEVNINKYSPMRGGSYIHLPDVIKNTKSCINVYNNDDFDLIRRKGIYPYEYIDSWEKYDETELPPKHCFYNSLQMKHITNTEYKHAQNVWHKLNISNLGEYTDLYLKCDVLLLCDIFENFRKICLQYYNLDPAYYVSSPGLSWDAMLLYTGVQLELIHDLEIYNMIEKGIRGGLAQCSHRYAKANNMYIPNFDDSKPSTYLIYLDCNNLYGHAMTKKLPISDFKLMTSSEIDNFCLSNIPDNAEYGYILEVDIAYPNHLHNSHNDLPFAPEKFIPIGGKTEKLIANLYDKYNYVIHYVYLKECLKNGLILKKIHRILQFKQEDFLKKYIDLNTQLRQSATTTFEKDFFKLLNNSIFGKTIENKRKQCDVKLVTKWRDNNNRTNKTVGAEKLITKPNLKSICVFSDDFIAVQLNPEKLILDRPIYIGFAVLEYAKQHLYNFHYDFIKKKYGEKAKLCYTDTDSLLYLLHTQNFYKDMNDNILKFDTSNFDTNNTYCIPKLNDKIPGLFKDELGGDVITEFIGLRAKLYSIKSLKTQINKAKGVSKPITKKLRVSDYKKVLFNNITLKCKIHMIKSSKHVLYSQETNKVILNGKDDKRLVQPNQIDTVSWGHCDFIC